MQDEGSSSNLPAAPPAPHPCPHPRAPRLACPQSLSIPSAPGPHQALEPGLLTGCIQGSLTHCTSRTGFQKLLHGSPNLSVPPSPGDLWRCEVGRPGHSPYDSSFGRFSSVAPEPGTRWLLCPPALGHSCLQEACGK